MAWIAHGWSALLHYIDTAHRIISIDSACTRTDYSSRHQTAFWVPECQSPLRRNVILIILGRRHTIPVADADAGAKDIILCIHRRKSLQICGGGVSSGTRGCSIAPGV